MVPQWTAQAIAVASLDSPTPADEGASAQATPRQTPRVQEGEEEGEDGAKGAEEEEDEEETKQNEEGINKTKNL